MADSYLFCNSHELFSLCSGNCMHQSMQHFPALFGSDLMIPYHSIDGPTLGKHCHNVGCDKCRVHSIDDFAENL